MPSACEEIVRHVSPVHSFGRTVTQDTELRGVPIKQGEKVLVLYPSANHDPAEFENPERFDVARNPHHVGFGVGNHFEWNESILRTQIGAAAAGWSGCGMVHRVVWHAEEVVAVVGKPGTGWVVPDVGVGSMAWRCVGG